MTRSTRCRKAEAWRVNGTCTTVTTCATQSWCCLFSKTSTLPMPESEQSGTTENGSHLPREQPGCSATRVENWGRAEHGQNLYSHRRQHHARSRCWVSAVHRGPAPEQGRCHPRNARARSTLPGSADSVLSPQKDSACQPYQPHRAGPWSQNSDEIGQRSLEWHFSGLTEDSMTQATLSAIQKSAGHRSSCTPFSPHRSQNAHPGHDP